MSETWRVSFTRNGMDIRLEEQYCAGKAETNPQDTRKFDHQGETTDGTTDGTLCSHGARVYDSRFILILCHQSQQTDSPSSPAFSAVNIHHVYTLNPSLQKGEYFGINSQYERRRSMLDEVESAEM